MSRQYVNFSILACVFLTSKALYNIGFEMYGDFPRVRALLDPRRYKPVVDSTHETPHEARETRNLSLWGNTLHVARGRELGAKKERAHNGSMAPMERRGSGVERAGDEAEEGEPGTRNPEPGTWNTEP
ncbi:hypothetical protein T484DRAFT_1824477 [Baffinella frigidus]|nr:hypothetical protein T484DRAFT_1824477 [Cryptophyta sp. CCMP2293]